MMRLVVVVALGIVVSRPVAAAPKCFELSADPKRWSREPDTLCLEAIEPGLYQIRLRAGQRTADTAVLQLDLLDRARCDGCNRDQFGLKTSSGLLGDLRIVFDGTRDPQTRLEQGAVRIGAARFHYRSGRDPSSPPVAVTSADGKGDKGDVKGNGPRRVAAGKGAPRRKDPNEPAPAPSSGSRMRGSPLTGGRGLKR